MMDLFSQQPAEQSQEHGKFVALNVQSPPPARARQLVGWLQGVDADALVLTELSGASGSRQLISDLCKIGFSALYELPDARDFAVSILLKQSVAIEPIKVPRELGARVACCKINTGAGEVILVGAYIPALGPQNYERRPRFLSRLREFIAHLQERKEPLLVMGDLNIVERDHLPRIAAFEAEAPFAYDIFSHLGLGDGYRHFHPHAGDHSWYDRFGLGQRLDHALMSHGLLARATHCGYLHDVRVTGLSDHSGLILELGRGERGLA
jgi:Exonuclease III